MAAMETALTSEFSNACIHGEPYVGAEDFSPGK